MNLVYRYLILFVLTFLVINRTVAQKASFETNRGMTIGFGVGAAYQQSDIANSKGGGFDFTLGSYLYKKENAFLSVDWKFRFLAGENMAHDHRINPDGTFSNIRYEFFNYDLEMGLTLNRLRERTRIVITGFAGAGITHGITATDLLDESGNLYDYSVIDALQSKKQVYTDLLNLTDGNYETKLTGKGALMPTAGIYLGYQFSRSFSLGIEHKINFSLTENNSFTGIDIDNNTLSGSPKDRNHYTSLGFKWIIGGRSSGSARRGSYTVTNTPVTVYNPPVTERPVTNNNPVISMSPPLVEIIIPSGNTYSSAEGTLEITARARNVKGKQDIQVVLNNKNIAFDFNPLYGNIKSKIALAEGKNTLIITASNAAGSNSDDVAIIYNRPVTVVLPLVKFIEPASPLTVNKNILAISVQTKNVKAWQDVTVTVNGTSFTNFNFSPEGVVKTNIPLKEGTNSVQVTGKNESGSASDFATITYTKPVKAVPPAINILNPGTSPFNTSEPLQEFKARITGVSSKENISLSFNGIRVSGFTYDDNSFVLSTSVTLREGSNTIMVTARNDAGQEVKTQEIFKETRPCPPPFLKMIEPAQNESATDNPSFTIRTEIRNIVARDQLSITLNNRPITNYNFNGNEIVFVASLVSGINTYVISAANNCSTQKITCTVFYKPGEVIIEKPCPGPGIIFSITDVNREDATHELKGSVSNVKNRSDITVTLNDNPFDGFTYVPGTGEISSVFKLNPGSYTIKVTVKNECGTDNKTASVSVQQPCVPPQVTINLAAVNRADATHELKGSVSNVKNRSDITVTLNDSPFDGFVYVPGTGEISSVFKLNPGSYTIMVTAKNDCGSDSYSGKVVIEELKPCGIRINPGNSSWEFCMVTPSGTIVRDTLTNKNFRYSGPASSLYFMPIAGGGDAVVKGKPYTLRPGQYYLFTGNLTVTVSTKNPGSMGQWSVCIIADREPLSGNGNNRPKSPCEEQEDKEKPNKNMEKQYD
ncbi:MAG: hypothetical protein IQL11_09515 [Bacteroidales bacterium]|nr:hypothetical protein [Bacteroidales bacterium]